MRAPRGGRQRELTKNLLELHDTAVCSDAVNVLFLANIIALLEDLAIRGSGVMVGFMLSFRHCGGGLVVCLLGCSAFDWRSVRN